MARAAAHWWVRQFEGMGHSAGLIAPVHVKPFVKRQKNDAADAEAIAEAAMRPTTRFVAVKTATQQERAMVFRTRDMLVRQRTQTINALRAHLAEHGTMAPAGVARVKRLAAIVDDEAAEVPELVRDLARLHLTQTAEQASRIAGLERRLRDLARESRDLARLQTMPGVGPITAVAIESFAPDLRVFGPGRDFSAWLGLVPRQHSTGGKQRLGRVSKMGEPRHPAAARQRGDVGRAVGRAARTARGSGACWLASRSCWSPSRSAPRMARALWAMATRQEEFRAHAA